jgi:hypothetical protein
MNTKHQSTVVFKLLFSLLFCTVLIVSCQNESITKTDFYVRINPQIIDTNNVSVIFSSSQFVNKNAKLGKIYSYSHTDTFDIKTISIKRKDTILYEADYSKTSERIEEWYGSINNRITYFLNNPMSLPGTMFLDIGMDLEYSVQIENTLSDTVLIEYKSRSDGILRSKIYPNAYFYYTFVVPNSSPFPIKPESVKEYFTANIINKGDSARVTKWRIDKQYKYKNAISPLYAIRFRYP